MCPEGATAAGCYSIAIIKVNNAGVPRPAFHKFHAANNLYPQRTIFQTKLKFYNLFSVVSSV